MRGDEGGRAWLRGCEVIVPVRAISTSRRSHPFSLQCRIRTPHNRHERGFAVKVLESKSENNGHCPQLREESEGIANWRITMLRV